ncbi:MAG: ABC transporter permease [Ignavibacteriaceae bacterium]|nr:ABC transporter permease [Ignavibacteriaceae bacterium]
MVSSTGKSLKAFFIEIGGMTAFMMRFFRYFLLPPYEFAEIRKHMEELGVKTLPIVSVTGFLIGFVLALQSHPILARFGAESVLPAMVALSVIRELGPVLTALIFAGRVSSGIGAELGSMRVTEQIDAMEVSAIDPFKFLVVTRIIACTMILPLLTMYVNFIALIGSYVSILLLQAMSLQLYTGEIIQAIGFVDLLPAVAKTFFFGFIVGLVGSFKGFNAEKGTEGVGKASTSSVVVSSLLILIMDSVLVKISLIIWPI